MECEIAIYGSSIGFIVAGVIGLSCCVSFNINVVVGSSREFWVPLLLPGGIYVHQARKKKRRDAALPMKANASMYLKQVKQFRIKSNEIFRFEMWHLLRFDYRNFTLCKPTYIYTLALHYVYTCSCINCRKQGKILHRRRFRSTKCKCRL